ncbi:hypothetical protein BOX15_Mlig002124g1 [Macrostomum lignano]|uniref:SNF-related serine/threonine-protein kinase n=1 Tax=Macrostomum lignano TaxID=282301 RepID=A0A267ERG4_9PLAT|nr:hypothetical protein BOX15_Mlig002124g1 [Macrostomum lignano]
MAQQQQHQLQKQQHVQRHFSIDSTIAGQYDLEHTIGRGHFAVVKLAKHTFTGEQVAVKVIDKSKLDAVSREHLFQEVMCMKLVQHPNVVRLYEVIDTANRLYLILELGDGGDLYDYILKHERGLKESMAKSFFHQIVTAIAYCHKLHVCHRDLKLENCVVFEKQGLVKLTDFGFSNVFTPGKFLETSCGSLAYSAPEILLGDSYDATKVDVWSLGVILFMLATGKLPFQEQNDSETLARIMDVRYRVPRHVSLPCRRLIERLLQRDPTRRPTLDSILEDEWLCGLPTLSCGTPLVCANEVSPEDQLEVVDKMVEGGLATRDEILAALGRDDYSHVTATYYLLAERLMRRARLERHRLSIGSSGGGRPPSRGQSAELESIPETAGAAAAAGGAGGSSRQSSCASLSVEEKLRRFSMIIEEEDIGLASLAEESGAALPGAMSATFSGGGSATPAAAVVLEGRSRSSSARHRSLVSVRSSPQLLLKAMAASLDENSQQQQQQQAQLQQQQHQLSLQLQQHQLALLGSGGGSFRLHHHHHLTKRSGVGGAAAIVGRKSSAGSRAGSSSESSDSPSRPLSEYSLGELACGGFGCCYESPDNPGFIADAVSSDHNIGGSLAAVVCCPIRELDEPPASLEASAAVGDTESPIVSAGGAFGQVQSVSASSSARQSRRRQSDGRQCSSANARDSSFSLNSSAASSSLRSLSSHRVELLMRDLRLARAKAAAASASAVASSAAASTAAAAVPAPTSAVVSIATAATAPVSTATSNADVASLSIVGAADQVADDSQQQLQPRQHRRRHQQRHRHLLSLRRGGDGSGGGGGGRKSSSKFRVSCCSVS